MCEVLFSCHPCIRYFGKLQVRLAYSHFIFLHRLSKHISSPATAFALALQCRRVSQSGRKLSLKMLEKEEHERE